ncbi:MAG: alpha-hydroxy-acid oxidizing protein [Alicyclobacillus sp.]|nr:alpha-hydroxy-acid oxidizing protein [Alicyclobacillus sp.]
MHREFDACGLYACAVKSGLPSRAPIESGLDALAALRHRAGYVRGEGDGCGLLVDIPRRLWADWLEAAGQPAAVADHGRFAVAHLMLPASARGALAGEMTSLEQRVQDVMASLNGPLPEVLVVRDGAVDPRVLGPVGRREDPWFVQIGLLLDRDQVPALKRALSEVLGAHVASCSHDTAVYKVIGDANTLWAYYRDLQDHRCVSTFCLAHNRYSTNTETSFARVQPFSVLGHNGEINTIARFQSEAAMIGIPLDSAMSDSQMVNEVAETLVFERGWSLYEVAELLFPPIPHEQAQLSAAERPVYDLFRSMWGPFAQGPAAMILRAGNEAVLSVDALGLRPLWLLETRDLWVACSEQGVLPPDRWVAEPKALAPGEKCGWVWARGGVSMHTYDALRAEVAERVTLRFGRIAGEVPRSLEPPVRRDVYRHPHVHAHVRAAAFGWREDDWRLLLEQARTAAEPIRSLGYDGPLAALRPDGSALADYLHETVAVVTNPAIDREREVEHFNTRALVGARPSFVTGTLGRKRLTLPSALLLDQLPEMAGEIDSDTVDMLARRCGTWCLDDALAALHDAPSATAELLIHRLPDERIADSLQRFGETAIRLVEAGARVLVLDDRLQFRQGAAVDPLLVTAAVHRALAATRSAGAEALRRDTGLILRSQGLRNLHDIMVALGLGADAVVPVLLWELAAESGGAQGLENVYRALSKGVEKVLSTLGIHELRGYERLFSAVGLHAEIADLLGVPHVLDGPSAGLGFAEMERRAVEAAAVFAENDPKVLVRRKDFRMYPRLWRLGGQVAAGELEFADFEEKVAELEAASPVSVRHLMGLCETSGPPEAEGDSGIDTSIDGHRYPILISSMSFGSQGEVAYRAYAEAARRLNIVAMNGEGGELKDLLTAYPRHRGRQIASGRFGVNSALCNHAYVLEIKIGQGAKPGEGGHLPGSKVTEAVASARHATPGTDLISPSNHHDIYSIEDLAQVIFELRTANPEARIAVKVPVVPNIGTISVGIAKAGADVIVMSGFDGGTGAARAHALQRVGLPVEIGIRAAHVALCEAGLRERIEIWADGGMKTATDVMKAILLGANRVGFGTMAMVALGCTACRACHKDTCHVGIATQIQSVEEAAEKGLPKFAPQEWESAVEHLVRFFSALGAHLARLTSRLGATRTQDLVGRVDLLEQTAGQQQLDLTGLLRDAALHAGLGRRVVYRTYRELYGSPAQAAAATEAIAAADAVGAEGPGARFAPEAFDGAEPSLDGAEMDRVADVRERVPGPEVHPWRAFDQAGASRVPRAVGTAASGRAVRRQVPYERMEPVVEGVAGNGFAAYQGASVHSLARGGAQDGVAKGMFGGRAVVVKIPVGRGAWLGGAVGKSTGYGAQHGLIVVQGDADARAGVRLSGADLVIAGEPRQPVRERGAFLGAEANIKGFAFEYMTAGRALVLGDPGPWICSGMTGGRVYLRLNPALGLTEAALRHRLAKGAKVALTPLDRQGELDVVDLLLALHRELRHTGQAAAARRLAPLLRNPMDHFLMVQPAAAQTDQDVATE